MLQLDLYVGLDGSCTIWRRSKLSFGALALFKASETAGHTWGQLELVLPSPWKVSSFSVHPLS